MRGLDLVEAGRALVERDYIRDQSGRFASQEGKPPHADAKGFTKAATDALKGAGLNDGVAKKIMGLGDKKLTGIASAMGELGYNDQTDAEVWSFLGGRLKAAGLSDDEIKAVRETPVKDLKSAGEAIDSAFRDAFYGK